MKRFIIAGLLIAAACWWWYDAHKPGRREMVPAASVAGNTNVTVTVAGAPATLAFSEGSRPLLGETILRDYASPASSPENDLTLLSRLMENFTLLVKTAKDRPLSANADWAAAFQGHNPAKERFLPDQHRALNSNGELVDRWTTPLFFHALGGGRYEIRSAGPDRQLWTIDDVHRNYDGSFRRGDRLNSPSLLETATKDRP